METQKKSTPAQQVLQANATFSQNLYKILSAREGNIFFSPLSIHAALSMLHHGAQGETAHALLRALKSTDPEGYKSVIDVLNSIEDTKLTMANKIYGNKNKNKLLKEFENILTKKFASEVELLDMAKKKEAAQTVNKWVEDKTDKKIKNIVTESNFNENTCLILINAIYFKGKWASQFEEKRTEKSKFFPKDKNESIEVEMMYRKGRYCYKHDKVLDAQIIEIPYLGHTTHMVIVLPSEGTDFKNFETKLVASDLSQILKESETEEVHLYLPKFKMEETIKMNDILKQMGLGNIFDMKKANFGRIMEGMDPTNNLFVSEVIQKTYIKLNEAGTEAAAATRVSLMLGCAPGKPAPPIVFKVDRPAIFMLVASHDDEEETRSILFFGRLCQPAY